MEIQELQGEPLGVSVTGLDLKTATEEEIAAIVDAMHRRGKGVLVVRDQVRPVSLAKSSQRCSLSKRQIA